MKTKNNKFWSVKAQKQSNGTTIGHLYLYGEISSTSWWGDEITPKTFLNDLLKLGEISELIVHICSSGGDVFAGNTIYSILKQQKAKVNVYIEGIAASIASVIAMAGDNIYISKAGMMYTHNVMFGLMGYYNANDLEKMIKELDRIKPILIAAYQSKTGKTNDEIVAILNGEDNQGTWFTAQDAINFGLANEIIPEEKEVLQMVACVGKNKYTFNSAMVDLSKYPNAPIFKDSIKSKGSVIRKMAINNNTKNEVVNVTCPECEHEFEWDNENETIDLTCPECGHEFSLEVEAVGDIIDEVIEVICPECGHVFNYGSEENEDEVDNNTKSTKNSYKSGIEAERKRISALDNILAAHPNCANIINKAKAQGWSFESTCNRVFLDVATKNKKKNNDDDNAENNYLNALNNNADKNKIGATPNGGNFKDNTIDENNAVNMIIGNNKRKES